MADTKHHRPRKRQLGQYLTPQPIADRLLAAQNLDATDRVLEPGFGRGAFLLALIERFLELRDGDLAAVLTENIWGIELDPGLYAETLAEIRHRWGELPADHHLLLGDFLRTDYPQDFFTLIIGNPPFGGTVDIDHQDALERRYGRRGGLKIKKETYSFFIVACLDLVAPGGMITFICSDTFLTIPTMRGLRRALMDEGRCRIDRLHGFSAETAYPMVVLRFTAAPGAAHVEVDGEPVPRTLIEATANLSWRVRPEFAGYFAGPTLAEFVICSSGMTTGRNQYFVREIAEDQTILEPYEFSFYSDPVTLDKELSRARLGRLSDRKRREILARQDAGETRRNVRITRRDQPLRVQLPHPDYRPYNKSQPGFGYRPARHAIFWRDDGDAVRTFKNNGNWYLHGVGGAPFFGREGLTWRLIAPRLDVRYLPAGYVLDSGSPCAFLREGVAEEELWFILGWTLTATASQLVKQVLNHTMNIQGKDVERIPYPSWVNEERKQASIRFVATNIAAAVAGTWTPDQEFRDRLDDFYRLDRPPN